MIKRFYRKNTLTIAAALVLTGIIFTGCGKKEAEPVIDENAQQEIVTENTSEAVEEPAEEAQAAEVQAADNAEDEAENVPSYQEAYKKLASELYEKYKDQEDEYSKLAFGLIYFDDDDIPELVFGKTGYYVYLYKYDNGNVITVIDNWPYGAGGNPGYDYCPKSGIAYNINSDMAGGERYETYYIWNEETGELEHLNEQLLLMRHYTDINGDGYYDWSDLDACGYLDDPIYFVDDKEVTKEEYDSYRYDGEFEPIFGEMTLGELISALEEE